MGVASVGEHGDQGGDEVSVWRTGESNRDTAGSLSESCWMLYIIVADVFLCVFVWCSSVFSQINA